MRCTFLGKGTVKSLRNPKDTLPGFFNGRLLLQVPGSWRVAMFTRRVVLDDCERSHSLYSKLAASQKCSPPRFLFTTVAAWDCLFFPMRRVAPYHIFCMCCILVGVECRLGLNGITVTGPSGAEIGGPFLDCRVFFGELSPAGGRWAASCGGFTVFQVQISIAKLLRVCPSHTRIRNPYSDIRTVKRRVFSIPNTDHYTCRTARSLDWSPAS